MFKTPIRAAACLALAAFAAGAHAATVYSLANNGTSLIRFDSTTPGAVTTVGAITGAATSLNGLDFRPANGLLYGVQQSNSGIYTVDTATGATTFVSTVTSTTPPGTTVTSPLTGIDFNPVPDRLRLVNDADQNLRINVVTGATTVDGTLAYAAGDPNAGANPNIIDAAYTNSRLGSAALSTQLFYIDYVLDTLVRTTNPNAGVLSTVGALGVDTSRFTGFDIFFDQSGTNTGFASLQVAGVGGIGTIDNFYTINLLTGAATLVGNIGAQNLFGLAVVPVPEPASLALVAAAGLAAFGVRRRKMGAAATT